MGDRYNDHACRSFIHTYFARIAVSYNCPSVGIHPCILPWCRCHNHGKIEQNMVGLDGFMYMSASSDSYGNSSIQLTFEPGTNADIAQVQVQNKMMQTQSQLPSVYSKTEWTYQNLPTPFCLLHHWLQLTICTTVRTCLTT